MRMLKKLGLNICLILCVLMTCQASAQTGELTPEQVARILPILFGPALDADPAADYDDDGLTNAEEKQLGTNYNNSDTDDDGVSDGAEVNVHHSNPLAGDSDGDGLRDGDEVSYGFSLNSIDSDLDGLLDSVDLVCGRLVDENDEDKDGICGSVDNCPLVSNADQFDSDGDGVGNLCDTSTSVVVDTDGDGYSDDVDICPAWPSADNSASACLCGDITGDGTVGDDDITRFADILGKLGGIAQNMTLSELERCDVDGDGYCTARDKVDDFLAGGGVLGTQCASVEHLANRALNRLGYGPDQWSKKRVGQLQQQSGAVATSGYDGLDAYILEQLKPAEIYDPEFTEERLAYSVNASDYNFTAKFPTVGMSISQLRTTYCNDSDSEFCPRPEDKRNRIIGNNREVKFLRSVHSRRQLDAVLLDFWFNHFNIDYSKGLNLWSHGVYMEKIHATMYGKFEDLVEMTAKTPTMLNYLDLNSSEQGASNENYARELMELHTLGLTRDGVDSFNHQDIVQVTKILTGWRYETASYTFAPLPSSKHDADQKVVTIGSGTNLVTWTFNSSDTATPNSTCGAKEATLGEAEGETLICLLSRHERTADLVSTKLIKRFLGETALLQGGDVSSDTMTGVLAAMKAVWEATDGDIDAVLHTLLLSDAFKRSLYYQDNKMKRPMVFVASLVRALGPTSRGDSKIASTAYDNSLANKSFNGLIFEMRVTGEELYAHAAPTGYSESSAAWASVAAMFNHFKAIRTVTASSGFDPAALGLAPSYPNSTALVEAVAAKLGITLSDRSRDIIVNYLVDNTTAEPVKQVINAVLSTPEFISQ